MYGNPEGGTVWPTWDSSELDSCRM